MKSKHRSAGRRTSALGLALLVALAFGAIAASGAQALDWQQQGGTTILSGTSSETVVGTGSGFTFTSTLLGESVEINCSSATTSGSIVGGGTGSSTIGLGSCAVAKPSHCGLASPPNLNAKVELVQAGGALFQKFVPAGTSFATLAFTGKECALNEATAPIKGSFAGRELSSALVANHSLSLTKSEPWPAVALTLGTKSATLTGEVTQHLSGNMANHGWRSIWQETHGGWEVEGSSFPIAQSVTVSGGPVNFSFYIAGYPVSFTCSETTASKGASLNPGGTETVNGLTFSGCKGETPSSCTVKGGSLQFVPVTGTLTRVNGQVYERFAATTSGQALTTISLEGSSCPLTETQYQVKGTFAGLGAEFGLYKVSQPLAFSKAASEATGSQLTIGGTVVVNMTGSISQNLIKATPWGAY